MDFRRIPHPEAGLLGYLGSWSKVRVEDSPPRVQVLPTHFSPTPECSRAFLEWLRETAGGIGRVAPADHNGFDDEPCGPDGGGCGRGQGAWPGSSTPRPTCAGWLHSCGNTLRRPALLM